MIFQSTQFFTQMGRGSVLQDLRDGSAAGMVGYSRIERCGAQAALDGWDYAWVDSCLIDKTSSSELSEAINSTYE
jgi:hypothetical protein